MKIRVDGLNEGLMVYWEEVKEAAVYHVHLIIGDINKRSEVDEKRTANYRQNYYEIKHDEEKFSEIDVVDVPRQTKYHSFVNLAPIHKNRKLVYRNGINWASDYVSGRNYYIVVEAEDRNGKIVDQSDRTVGEVLIHSEDFEKAVGKMTGVII